MNIWEIDSAKLPYFMIESFNTQHEVWQRFTHEPFDSEADAEAHKQKIIEEYKVDPRNLRVTFYTADHWRADLIKLILKDEDAIRRGLSVLRSETLADLLR